MSSWTYNVIAATNRVARLRSGGSARLPLRAQAAAASELCKTYWQLLLDPEFKQYVEKAIAESSAGLARLTTFVTVTELRCHISEAVALLVEAGVDGTQAIEAVRSVEELVSSGTLEGIEPRAFFARLRDAKDAMCELRDRLRVEAAAEESRWKLRRAGLAGAGLALVGLVGCTLAVVAAPAVGVSAAAAAAGSSILTAIGTTVFDHNTQGLK